MDAQEELATLEAERDRLLAVVAYHRGPAYSESKDDAKPWSVFGFEFTLSDLVGALIAPTFAGRPAGEPQVLQRLAECEARIVKLKAASL
ncbi:hypothetical protein [Bradyrhizobium japonicum]|uniref:hypothetical protein n=1 Tax=Bradyrhizobium japonicum TaxID=375 RepID=UPI001BAAA06F|nr:hypothetical protein [Bradyrhizobium japonicum]MBR0956200.1 hypothetical protein [Bradyrhizobium japonicum]